MTDRGIKRAATQEEYARVPGANPRSIIAHCSDGLWIRRLWVGPAWKSGEPIGAYGQHFGWDRWKKVYVHEMISTEQ